MKERVAEASFMGLRARKREDTRRRLKGAAREVVLRDGFDAARLGEICSRADVAPRTFFNYFSSKEDAVVGSPPCPVPELLLEAHRKAYAGMGTAHTIIGLVLSLLAWPLPSDRYAAVEQTEVLRRNPELLSWQLIQIFRSKSDILPVIDGYLRDQAPEVAAVDSTVTESILILCLAAVRNTIMQRLSDGGASGRSDIEDAAASTIRLTVEHLTATGCA